MAVPRKKESVKLEYEHWADGTNTADSEFRVGDNQCVNGTKNAILGKKSTLRRPGSRCITNEYSYPIRGIWSSLHTNGAERMLSVDNGWVRSFSKT